MTGMGHNIAADRLKSFIERIERMNEEIAALNADKREIFAEAKAAGFDTKIIKMVVRDRGKDGNDLAEQNALYGVYWDAVHGTSLAHAHEEPHPDATISPASEEGPEVAATAVPASPQEEAEASDRPSTPDETETAVASQPPADLPDGAENTPSPAAPSGDDDLALPDFLDRRKSA